MSRRREIIETFNFELGDLLEDYHSLLGDIVDSKNTPRLTLNIDATHSGRLTNDRVYPGPIVKDSFKTFLKPKGKPVLKNHDSRSDPIGRVVGATFTQLKQGKAFSEDFKKPTRGIGSGVVKLDLDVMDFDAIEKFLDGRFQEFSTRQEFDGFFCSFCGSDFTKSYCGHYPGDTVIVEATKKGGKDKEYFVYGITGPLYYKEVSVVNVPADMFTNINEMEMKDCASSDKDVLISFKDDISHQVSQLFLASSAGDKSIDLFSAGKRQSVTSKDRESLTGKTVITVVGPGSTFKNIMYKDKKKEVKDEQVEDLENKEEETQNTDNTKSSNESDASKSSQDDQPEDKGEGVKAPQVDKKDNTDETDISDLDVANASIKALVKTNQKLEDSVKTLTSEIERVKGEVSTKDEEVARLQTTAAEAQSKLKESTARQLLDNKLILGRPDIASIKDKESYELKLAELSKRSLESLNDALEDLSPELSLFREKSGFTKVFGKQVANPVLNGSPDIEAIVEDKEPDGTEQLSTMQRRNKIVDSHL